MCNPGRAAVFHRMGLEPSGVLAAVPLCLGPATLLEAAASVSVPGTLEVVVYTPLACRRGQCPSCSPSLKAAPHYMEDDSEQVSPRACAQVCRMYPGEGHLLEEADSGHRDPLVIAHRLA